MESIIKPEKCKCGREIAFIYHNGRFKCYLCVKEKISINEDLIIQEAAKILEKRKNDNPKLP